MTRKAINPIVRAVTDLLWERDKLQMRAADALLSAVEPPSAAAPEAATKRHTRGTSIAVTRTSKRSRSKESRTWDGFRSLLCAVDFSEASRLALRYAETVAVRLNAELRVAYVNDPLLVEAAAVALHDRSIAKRSAGELEDFVDSTLSRSGRTRLHPKLEVSVGDPADEILKAGDRHRADLIVMGTHGLTGADRLFMGSTTLSVLQHTTVPVLAIPPAAAPEVPPSWPGPRIMSALELDRGAQHEVDIAARIAHAFGASLSLIHVVNDVARPAWVTGDLSVHDRARVAQAQRELDDLAATARQRVPAEARVICGRIADEIVAVALADRSTLLMTALRNRRGWFGTKRGGLSYHVLSHAVTPVLAYPAQWRPR